MNQTHQHQLKYIESNFSWLIGFFQKLIDLIETIHNSKLAINEHSSYISIKLDQTKNIITIYYNDGINENSSIPLIEFLIFANSKKSNPKELSAEELSKEKGVQSSDYYWLCHQKDANNLIKFQPSTLLIFDDTGSYKPHLDFMNAESSFIKFKNFEWLFKKGSFPAKFLHYFNFSKIVFPICYAFSKNNLKDFKKYKKHFYINSNFDIKQLLTSSSSLSPVEKILLGKTYQGSAPYHHTFRIEAKNKILFIYPKYCNAPQDVICYHNLMIDSESIGTDQQYKILKKLIKSWNL